MRRGVGGKGKGKEEPDSAGLWGKYGLFYFNSIAGEAARERPGSHAKLIIEYQAGREIGGVGTGVGRGV